MEIVIISCKAIKFDEITVTSQANKPRIPAVEITEMIQINIGIRTHLKCLKIYHKTNIKIKTKEEP